MVLSAVAVLGGSGGEREKRADLTSKYNFNDIYLPFTTATVDVKRSPSTSFNIYVSLEVRAERSATTNTMWTDV